MGVPTSDNEPSYFAYSATLRIHGVDLPFEGIAEALAVTATHVHRAGEERRFGARPYEDDGWHYTAPVPEDVELTEHLRCLWRTVEPHVRYLKALNATVDVFCGYRSNIGAAGFAVEPDALQIFSALNVPFGVSVIVDSWLSERLSQPTEHLAECPQWLKTRPTREHQRLGRIVATSLRLLSRLPRRHFL